MWSPINPFHRSTSQATTRSTTCSGILASVPGGALCTAGAAMLGSASSDYWLHAASHPNAAFSSIFTLKPCRAGPHHRFSPARACSGNSFRLSGPWASASHPISDSSYLTTPFFHSNFTDFSIFVHAHTRFGHPPYPPSSIWAIFRHMAQCHHPSTGFSPTNSIFFIKVEQLFDFSHVRTPVVVSTTHPGLPSPPTIDRHTSHPTLLHPSGPGTHPLSTFWPFLYQFFTRTSIFVHSRT